MDFQVEPDRVFSTNEHGDLIAEVTFPACDGVANINHTFVDGSLRGQGVASVLLDKAVECICKQNLKIQPTCPYAVKWFQTHAEHDELLHRP